MSSALAMTLNPRLVALSAMLAVGLGMELALLGSRRTLGSKWMNHGSVRAGMSKRTLKGAKTAPMRGATRVHVCIVDSSDALLGDMAEREFHYLGDVTHDAAMPLLAGFQYVSEGKRAWPR